MMAGGERWTLINHKRHYMWRDNWNLGTYRFMTKFRDLTKVDDDQGVSGNR